MAISFSCADLDFELVDEKLTKKWIASVVNHYGMHLGRITYLFCSYEYVYKANMKYLNHDTYTDIITFDCVEGNLISGDIVLNKYCIARYNLISVIIGFYSDLYSYICI